MPDLLIAAGQIQPKPPFYVGAGSAGQYSLSNAARAWTKLWLVLEGLGWTPGPDQSRCLHRVRVSFRFGSGSFIDGLISNPRFFELSMGWPIGWTAPEQPVTGFAHWKLRSRGQLSKLISSASGGCDA